MELKKYWAIIRKRIWLISLLVLVSTTITGIYSYTFTEKRYSASTKIIVNQNQDLAVVNGKLDLGTINSNIQLIKTYKEIIRSPRIMKLVAEQYPELGMSPNQLISMVSVSAVDQSQVMSVHATDATYSRAANVVNAVAEVFRKEIPKLMKVDNVNILNGADPEAKAQPVSYNPNLTILISLALSLMAGLGLTFLLDYLDDTVKTEEEVSQLLGLATFSHIPHIKRNARNLMSFEENKIRGEGNVTVKA